MRLLLLIVSLLCCQAAFSATCERGNPGAKSDEPIVDWYDNFIRPYRYLPPAEANRKPTRTEVEDFIDVLGSFNRGMSLDQFALEPLVRQILESYARAPNFSGIDNATVEKLYRTDGGQKIDFSLFCISPRTLRTPNDAFSVTLFGVIVDDCQHVGMRGLVFSSALINGSPNGQCRPDLFFRKKVLWPILAGTNEITFLCGKDIGGCAR